MDKIYGPGEYSSQIDTPEKRACWRVGHETQNTGALYLDYDFKFVWTAPEDGSVTGYDEYYRNLGVSALRQAGEEWKVDLLCIFRSGRLGI